MKTHLTLLMALLAPLLVPVTARAQSAPIPDQNQVVPGERIGRVFIGDSRAAVHRRIGKPTKVFKLMGGRTSELWRGSKRTDTDRPNTLEVIFERGAVIQIETTNTVFRTKSGLNVVSGGEEWFEALGLDPTISRRRYPKRANRTYQYHDWRRTGIALELIETEDEPSPETLIVHRRGFSVIPDVGGVARPLKSRN